MASVPRPPRRPRAALFLAIVAAFVFSGLSLAAPRGVQLISHQVEIVPDEPEIHVCAHATAHTEATIWDVTTFKQGGATHQTLRQTSRGKVIRINIASATVASVAPALVVLDPADRTAHFAIKGLKAGRTTITLTEPTGASVAPGTMDVIVDDCQFKFSGWSTWDIPDGFRPQTYAIFEDLNLDWAEDKQAFVGTALIENSAVAGNPNGCTVDFDVQRSIVNITVKPNDVNFNVTISYGNVQVATRVLCGVRGGRTDAARPDQLTWQLPLGLARGRYALPFPGHILRAGMAVPGDTFIKLEVSR